MADEIADFLRLAAQRRHQQRPPDIEILDADVVEDAEIIEAEEVTGDDVAGHVSHHLDTSTLGDHASHLGESIGRADDRMESHLHKVFEHGLGQLGTKTSVAEESTLDDDERQEAARSQEMRAAAGLDIPGMLRTPKNLRDAIILSEILQRPEDRW